MEYFLEGALIHTDKTIKRIQDLEVGDQIINKEGDFDKIVKIEKKLLDSPQIKITHTLGTNKYFPMVCTEDYPIYTKKHNKIQLEKSKNLFEGDIICLPKINKTNPENIIIDLNNYNTFGYAYDDKYIYEFNRSRNNYKYNTSEVARAIGVSTTTMEDYAQIDCKKNFFSRKPEKLTLLREYLPFSTREEYCKYVEDSRTKKVSRFIEVDKTFNQFIGLMYGDGFTNNRIKNYPVYRIGMAINAHNHKNTINRKIFNDVATMLNLEMTEKDRGIKRNCIELYISSVVFSNFFTTEIFTSDILKEKQFNTKLFDQSNKNLKGIIEGLVLSDGHRAEKYIEFGNTSKSLINAYKILCLKTDTGVLAIEYVSPGFDSRGVPRKEAFKMRRSLASPSKTLDIVTEDDKFYYLPVKKRELLNNQCGYGYSIQTKENNGFLVNNMLVGSEGCVAA